MKRYPLILGGLLGACLAPATLIADRPLPMDNRIQTGKLDNGVIWLFRKHDNPPGKMALMIHVRTGSLNEKDSQRGLAHFLEHMCFNGSEHFPPGALIPYFESIGMEFGADLNASTSFDATRYMLFTPNTDEAQIDKALMVLSDYAFRASLPEEEINKERGVVLEEARSGKSAAQRVRDELWPKLFEGSRFAARLPIGDEKVIAGAPRSEFVDYYRAWYRPENIAVFVVGDAPADRIIPLIQKWFGEYRPEGDARPPLTAEFKPFTKERTLVVTDPELPACEVEMSNVRPGRPAITTVEGRRTELLEDIGSWIMERRYDERRRKGEAHYRSAAASVSNFFNEALLVGASATGEPKDWAQMLEELIAEVNRAHAYGFTQRELDLAKREFMASAERAVRTEPTINARALIFGMVRAVNDRVPILSAQQELVLYQELLPSVELSEVSAAFNEHFAPGAFAFVVTMPQKEGVTVPSREEVLSAARAALAQKPEAPTEKDTPTELLAALPKPGKVADTAKDKDLNITSLWLENGVRVHHRYMDYKKDTVLMTIGLAGGDIEETAGNRGITQVAALAVTDAATSRLTSMHIRDIIIGKNIRVIAARGVDDAFTLQIVGSPRDLETGLQLAYALLTDGKIEDEAFENWRLRILQRIDGLEKQPTFWASQAVADFTGGGDARAKFLTKPQVQRLSAAEGQAWFDRLCRESPIEVSIVGDVKLDDVQPLVLRYVGSLPQRKRTPEHLAALRRWDRKPGPAKKRLEVRTITPQAYATAGFIGADARNVDDDRALQLADNILSSRLVKRIREDLALVYSIQVQSRASWAYEDAGRFQAGATCDPENSEKVAKEIHDIYQDFAERGPTDEELDNAKKQIAENLDTAMREPTYWSDVLEQLDFHGRSLEREKKHKEAFGKISVEEVQAAFKKYYKPERSFQVVAVPVKPPEPEKKEGDDASKKPAPAPTP